MEDVTMKKTIIAMMALAALFSCNKQSQEENTRVSTGKLQAVEHELRATIPETKVAITESGNSYSFVFETGDEIAVFNGVKDSDTHLPVRYKCTQIEGNEAVFSYSPASGDDTEIVPDTELATVVATYPYRSPSTGAFEEYGANTLKIRMVATGNTSKTEGPVYIKTSTPMVASADKDATLNFVHSVGLLELTVKGTATLKGLSVTSDQNISGDASVSYTATAPVLSVKGTGKNITYTYGSGVALNNEDGVKFYVALPVGTHNLSFVLTDSADKTMTITTPGVVVERAKVTKGAFTYSADPLTNVKNLSEFGHFANCYVVSAAGNYCFNARKPDGTAVSGTSAVWVWASGEACSRAYGTTLPATMMADVALEDGKIFFTVPANYAVGNVVLGIIDSNKELLYTWHVWLTSADLTDISTSGITVMDRNLGAGALYDVEVATSATPLQNGKGNYYQWGRKDPILGARNSSSGNSVTTFKDDNNSQKCNINTSAGISNVSDFWTSGGDFGGFTADLGAKFPITMAASGKVPGYIANDTTTPWSERTNANPCPYGYKVMTKAQFDALIDVSVAAAAGVGEYNTANFGQVKLAGSVIIPRTGFRSGGGGTQYGTTSARYYCDDVSSTEANKGQYYKFDWSGGGDYSGASAGTYNAYNACNVRCVKDI